MPIFIQHAVTAAEREYNYESDFYIKNNKYTSIPDTSTELADFFIPSHSTVEVVGDGYVVKFSNTSSVDKEMDYEIRHRAEMTVYEDPPPTYDEGELDDN